MAKLRPIACLITIIFLAILAFSASASTDKTDVQALRDLYRSLNSPPQLKEWKLDGGDPCDESWTGVSCFGSSVIHLKLHGLELTGTLGFDLSNLRSLKQLDLSSNHIHGDIPYFVLPNVTQLNLSGNNFSQSIPYSLVYMKHLRHLNLSHNTLSGPLGDVFNGLENLVEMDLSFNNFTGDLPTSFKTLTNLTRLFLQGNEFTGSVIFLANLPLSDLNIEDNHFSGLIPEKFQYIHNLWIGGNQFNSNGPNYPPWNFPSDSLPNEQNITTPPSTNLSAIERYPSHKVRGHKKKGQGAAGIVLIVGGGTLIASCAALFLLIRIQRSRREILESLGSREGSTRSSPISIVRDYLSTAEDSPNLSSFSSPPMINPFHLPPIRSKMMKVPKRKGFSKDKMSAKVYSLSELQSATNSFSEGNLLGEGSLGCVHRAEFPDGMIVAVKSINTVPLSIIEEEEFLDVIRNISRLRHPNIVTLLGYCTEHGQHLLVYEYIRNFSLDEALHSVTYKPLSWGLRIRIALGVARALNYMHSSCLPPIAHSNLKAANILLDEELMPHISDCSLAILRPLTSNSVKLKASEMAIADSGYIVPENFQPMQPGIANTKADVYAFGVLLLELLTGRRPFDCSRPSSEQSLVKWASFRLHDRESLGQMVDPLMTGSFSSKSLSRFADIVSLCIQPDQEFRPPISEIVESLACLLHRPGTADGAEVDPFDRSFRSTNTRFCGSPTLSYYSI
ncbi:STRUBBELIG-RECEPTOR FAMILY 2 [Olea europaea subsp. europaea]|uniref:STRUBBELIG-RECEPTOR FAMILY 2 n=1 Tax=Olea europaea subsp. europaea TaxID=158383 RepID=A0A8S0PCM3_OLEEU|nr:STRUBBELIG-RECEPTOR FAMILY 2 [Olea europaea subsp. europaea]